MHGTDNLLHLIDGRCAWFDHEVNAVTQDLQLCVGDEHSNFDKLVPCDVQAGHLAIDPDQQFAHCHAVKILCLSMISSICAVASKPIRFAPAWPCNGPARLAWSDRMRGESGYAPPARFPPP